MGIQDYSEKYNEIASLLLKDFVKARRGENIVISSMSIILLLGIAADATQGKTRDEVLNLIGNGISYEELMNVLKEIQEEFTESDSLISLNAVCVKSSIGDTNSEEYKKLLHEIFDGELFASHDLFCDVSEWIKIKTKGLIRNIAY